MQQKSVQFIPVNLKSILIAGERCNLFSCCGHLCFKTLLGEQYSEVKVCREACKISCCLNAEG